MSSNDALNKHIDSSVLLEDEKSELQKIFALLSEDQASHLVSLVEENPSLIPYLWVNYSAKRYALSKGDTDSLRTVVDSELEFFEDLV